MAKFIRLSLLLVTALFVLWAFGDVTARQIKLWHDRSSKPITLTVMHWGGPEEDQIVKDLVTRYEQTHPNLRIVRINTGDPGAFRSKLKTMLSAGEPPDVFYLPPDLLPDFAQLKLIRTFDDFLRNQPREWVEDFYPVLLDAFRYDADTGLAGSGPLYALPKDFTTAVFYINVELFDEAGVDWRGIQASGWTWDRFEAEMKKIRALNELPKYKDANREVFGSLIQIWPDTLRNIVWTFGGDFFANDSAGKPDFAHSTLGKPEAQKALDLIARMRLRDRTSFNAVGIAKDGGQEFRIGNIGCTGPVGRWWAPQLKSQSKFRWDVLPLPYATNPASQIFYTGWTLSSTTKQPDEAFKLAAFLCGKEGQIQQSRDGLSIPALQSVANSTDFLGTPMGSDGLVMPAHNAKAFLDAIPHMRIQQTPRQQEWAQLVDQQINRAIQTGQDTPAIAAQKLQDAWAAELNSPLRSRAASPMPWTPILLTTLGIGATVVTLLWIRARQEKLGTIDRATERAGWMFITPWLIGFLGLTLGPMIVSLLLSMARWTGLTPMGDAEFVGSANFTQLLTADTTFLQSIKVTAYYVLLGVPVFQAAALAVAMLMNSNVRGIAIFRTIYFVPSVVSGVAMAVLWLQLFNNEYGLINSVLKPFAHLLGTTPPNWFGVDSSNPDHPVNDAARWAIPAFVLMGIWGVGGGMIIYLAGLKGIPASLYEAARIDGAGAVRRFWNVTLPMLSPLIFYNLVMGIIGSFQVFTQAYTMTGAGPDNATLFYVLQLYRQAFEFHNMGYASAMAWVLFVAILALTLLVFRGSKKLVYYEGLK